MNKLTSLTLIGTKLFYLFCLSGMFWINSASAEILDLKAPCHGSEKVVEQTTEKDCDKCEKSLSALDHDLVTHKDLTLSETNTAVLVSEKSFNEISFKSSVDRRLIYRPPPSVVLANAVYQPQKTTVLIV